MYSNMSISLLVELKYRCRVELIPCHSNSSDVMHFNYCCSVISLHPLRFSFYNVFSFTSHSRCSLSRLPSLISLNSYAFTEDICATIPSQLILPWHGITQANQQKIYCFLLTLIISFYSKQRKEIQMHIFLPYIHAYIHIHILFFRRENFY